MYFYVYCKIKKIILQYRNITFEITWINNNNKCTFFTSFLSTQEPYLSQRQWWRWWFKENPLKLFSYAQIFFVFLQAKEIDALYFQKDALDKINFPGDVVTDFQEGMMMFLSIENFSKIGWCFVNLCFVTQYCSDCSVAAID